MSYHHKYSLLVMRISSCSYSSCSLGYGNRGEREKNGTVIALVMATTAALRGNSVSSDLPVLCFIKGHGHTVPRSTDDLGLVELGMPVPAVLDAVVLLQQTHH